MTVEEYVGQRIRERRAELELSAVEFGSRLGHLLGEPWPRQAVSAAELGKRSLGVAELVAIAQVLRTSPTYLLTPPAGVGEIIMPSGAAVSRDLLFALVTTGPRDDLNLGAAERTGLDPADKESLFQPTSTAVRPPRPVPPVVAVIVTSLEGVLVGRRHDGKPPWTFMAGEVEPGEQPADAAVREVREETGLEIRVGQVIGEREHPVTHRRMIYLAATPTHGTNVFVGDSEELAEVRWAGLIEAGELLPGMFGPVSEYLTRELGGEE